MKHDQNSFIHPQPVPARSRIGDAYGGDSAERIRRFQPMVRRLAWHVHGAGRPGIEVEDLIQAGLVALTECARRHAGPGEDGFAAYAKMRVRGAMVDLVRRALPISRGAASRRKQLREAHDALAARLGRRPEEHEIADELGITMAEIASLRATSEPLRFEAIDEVYSDHNPAFADDRPDSLDQLAEAEIRESLTEAIAGLSERLQMVVQLYFVEEMNLSEIAGVLGVSIPRVHQLKSQALDQLRKRLDGLAEFV